MPGSARECPPWRYVIASMSDGPPPELPADVRCEASRRYIEAFEQITGRDFEPDTEDPQQRIRRNLGLR